MGDVKLLIHVGSTSEHKIAAVRAACEELCLQVEVVGIATRSDVNEQPYGLEETTRGATARAWYASMPKFGKTQEGLDIISMDARGPDLAIGIESGVIKIGLDAFVDMSVTVVRVMPSQRDEHTRLTSSRSKTFLSVSSGHRVDALDVGLAMTRGFDKHTVSSVTRERTGCDATDSTPHYTGGRVHRKECLQQAVKIALSQWLTWRERKAGDE